jgi:hypothetical protein
MEYPILCLKGEVLYSVSCSEIKYILLLLCFSGGDVVFIALSVEVRLTLGVNAFSITNFNLRCFVNLLIIGSCSLKSQLFVTECF